MSFLSAARRCPWKDSSASSSSGDTPDRNKRAAPAAPPSAGAGAGASELSLFGGLQLGRFGKEELRCCYIFACMEAPPPPLRALAQVLSEQTPGEGGKRGLRVVGPVAGLDAIFVRVFCWCKRLQPNTAHSGHDPLMGIQHWSKAVSD